MPSAPLSSLLALATPTPTAIMYAVLDPFAAGDDRKITINDLLSTITAGISDISLQFDDGVGTATVSAAGKGKIRYNDTAKAFQVSIDGGAYTAIGGGGSGSPGAPADSVQFNDAGNFGGNAGFLYTPTADPNVLITGDDNAHTVLSVKSFSNNSNTQIFKVSNSTGSAGLQYDSNRNTFTQNQLAVFDAVGNVSIGIETDEPTTNASARLACIVNGGAAFFQANNTQGGNTNFSNVPDSALIFTSSLSNGLVVNTLDAAPIVFATGGTAFSNERGRFDANGLTLGKASTANGKLTLAVSGSANTQSHTAPAAPASSLTFVWPSADPTAGQQLTASAPVAGVVTLSWT